MTPAALFKPIRWDERKDRTMLAEKMYVVKSSIVWLRRPDQRLKTLAVAPAPKPAPRRLEDRPLIINGKAVN
jgi:hypothetical protein